MESQLIGVIDQLAAQLRNVAKAIGGEGGWITGDDRLITPSPPE